MKTLEARDLYRFYHVDDEETRALSGVSVELDAGEMVAIQGPSGSGKSTLISCLAGLEEPDGGSVRIGGVRITRRPEAVRAAMRAREMGILRQSGNLFDHLSVEDNMRMQLRLAGKKDRDRGVARLLDLMGLTQIRRSLPAHISGGETARAGLAVALCAQPRLLLADEPTGEVDAEIEGRILELLDTFRSTGGAILIVTHSDAVASRADRTLHLLDGRILNDG